MSREEAGVNLRRILLGLVALLALVGVAAGPAVADEEPCMTIEEDGRVYVYPENCTPESPPEGQNPG